MGWWSIPRQSTDWPGMLMGWWGQDVSVDGATLEPNATEHVGCCNCWAHVWDVAGMLAVGC